MTYQEINIQTHTGSDGIAHIDIPTGIADRDIEVKVSYSTTETDRNSKLNEDAELAAIIANAKPATDLAEFRGIIEITEDPVEYQRRIRDEW